MPKNKARLCLLGPDWIAYIHDELIHKFWSDEEAIGSRGTRDRGLLESAVGRPSQSAFGVDAYPTLVRKAAALFHSLVANHPFHDGNKRTAVISLHHFLIANGFLIALSNEEAYRLAKRTASYRERGSGHDEILREIIVALDSRLISFHDLRAASKPPFGNWYFSTLLSEAVVLRRKIRRNRSNQLISPD